MDGASPLDHGRSGRPAGGGAALPAPGTVIMANVEEDMGDGMYSLRWAGQRITVSSQAVLSPGQSLILKSEASPEGRTRLVVQGPALPEAGHALGRVVYRPGRGMAGGGETVRAAASGKPGDAGIPVAAGLGKASVPPLARPVESMLGALLEPLDPFEEKALLLLREAAKEKAGSPSGDARPESEEKEAGTGPRTVEDQGAKAGAGPAASARESGATGDRPLPTRGAMEADGASPVRASGPPGQSGMPDAIVDKAAALLLRAAGVDPEGDALEAARALVRHNAGVDRETVAAMVELAAGMGEAAREETLRAAARLAARGVPLAEPLVAGLAATLGRRDGAHELLAHAEEALEESVGLAEADRLMATARDLLAAMRVDLGREDAGLALERFATAFGRETLGKALALIETAAQAVLENDPFLQKTDAALAALLRLLEGEIARQDLAGGVPPEGGGPLSPAMPLPALLPPSTGTGTPIDAYRNAPKAVSVEALLGHLPPMPKLARLDMPFPQIAPPPRTDGQPEALPEEAAADGSAGTFSPAGSKILAQGLVFQTPGANRPEMDMLKPSGLLERFLAGAYNGAQGEDGGLRTGSAALLRRLLSETPAHVKAAMAELPGKDPALLREAAARLGRMETQAIRENASLNRLADAAGSLREMGRQLLAAKAENISGAERDPGVMLAEVPFKLGDQAGDGRMQMFYRRSKKTAGGWTSRVILDLNTTRLGPLLGDLRFFAQEVTVTLFVETAAAAAHLEEAGAELVEAVSEKGFRVKTRFMVIPQVPAETAPRTEESGPFDGAGQEGNGRLDVRG